MSRYSTPRTVTTGPWLALVTALAVVVAIVAVISTLVVRPGPNRAQDAIAHIPVSTATLDPYASTATSWITPTPAAVPRDQSPAQGPAQGSPR